MHICAFPIRKFHALICSLEFNFLTTMSFMFSVLDFLTKMLHSFVMSLIGWGCCRRGVWCFSLFWGLNRKALVRSPPLMEMFIALICGSVLRSAVIIHKAKRSNMCCCQGDKLSGADFIFLTVGVYDFHVLYIYEAFTMSRNYFFFTSDDRLGLYVLYRFQNVL